MDDVRRRGELPQAPTSGRRRVRQGLKHRELRRFLADYRRLSRRERQLFIAAIREINRTYANSSGWPPRWPANLRIKLLSGHTGIWEMTWSFAGPDGRATFEFIAVDGQPAIQWRRIGGHDIFAEP